MTYHLLIPSKMGHDIEEFAEKYVTYGSFMEMIISNVHHHYDVLKDLIYARYGRDKNIVGCEVGLRGGLTELVLLRKFPRLKMYAIDLNDNETWLREHECSKRITFIYKPSDEAVLEINEPLDFVFIDGSKEYWQNKKDFINYSRLVKPGGLVISWQEGMWEKVWGNGDIFHDWPEKQISKGAKEVFGHKEIIFDGGLLWHVEV